MVMASLAMRVAVSITHMGIDGSYNADALFHHLPAALDIGGNALDTFFGEYRDDIAHNIQGLQQVESHHRFHDVELSWPASAAMVMVMSLPTTWKATWLTTSGHDRVDLARHNGRTGLHGGQVDFVQAAPWSRSHEAQSRGHLGQVNRADFQCSRQSYVDVGILRGINHVFRLLQRQSGVGGNISVTFLYTPRRR